MPQHLESCIAAELGSVPTWTTTVPPYPSFCIPQTSAALSLG